MPKRMTPNKIIELIVSRSTKGAAFSASHEQYRTLLDDTRKQVAFDMKDLPNVEFKRKYEMYLYDVRFII